MNCGVNCRERISGCSITREMAERFVVQYQRDFAWDGKAYAPYPAKIGNKPGDPLPRITDENSPVKLFENGRFASEHAEQITQDDFKGWVQERGLYFWKRVRSSALHAAAGHERRGEKDLDGAAAFTRSSARELTFTRASHSSGNCQRACREPIASL